LTIHYHGTPITPREKLETLKGKHFCVSFAEPRDADWCIANAQSVLWDNGEFSRFTKGVRTSQRALHAWLEQRLFHPHRAVVLDEINGSVAAQRELLLLWPHPVDLSWPVWHLDKPLDYLLELADGWPGICFGSAGAFWKVGAPDWQRRMDAAFEHLARHRQRMPWAHGLRMLGQVGKRWPLSSADSTNVARNHAGNNTRGAPAQDPKLMAERIDAIQSPSKWSVL
jgi:hypothetical protein